MPAYIKKVPALQAIQEISDTLPAPTVMTKKELNQMLDVAPQLVGGDFLLDKLRELGKNPNFKMEVVTKAQLDKSVVDSENNTRQKTENNVIIDKTPSIQDKINGYRGSDVPENTRKLKN